MGIVERKRLKRYIVFAGEYYYPSGGMYDLIGYTSELAAGKRLIETHSGGGSDGWNIPDWAHILDTETAEILDMEPLLLGLQEKRRLGR